ncbi:hypothetical protein Q7P37_001067 [Cladosporium fusiforme]
MCGIFCSLSRIEHALPDQDVLDLLQRRGPDCTASLQHTFHRTEDPSTKHKTTAPDVHLTFTSTVLSLRGSETVSQPMQDESNSHILCWNGEAWAMNGVSTQGNDTVVVFDLLLRAAAASRAAQNSSRDAAAIVAKHMSSIAGPYAFVFYDKIAGRLYLGRDLLGRRSLLWKSTPGGDLAISSVTSGSPDGHWTEIEADGIYCIDLMTTPPGQSEESGETAQEFSQFSVCKVPYQFANDASGKEAGTSVHSAIPFLSLNEELPSSPDKLKQSSPSVARLEQLLRDSLTPRVCNIPDPPPLPGHPNGILAPTRLAILFSGGLDCTVLARLSHDLLPGSEPIDLLNVAFQNPRIHKNSDENEESYLAAFESCPDRITGRASYAELCQVCPDRQWRFVAINIPYTETVEHRDSVIRLMHPHNTEMDLSIACALYFAARGTGTLTIPSESESRHYTTQARVLLSGLGADELFAGYTRHATAFTRHGFQGLLDELNLDIGRLGKRNLGRDDRAITNWGREARFPFLDEDFVAWALAAPVSDKCDFGAPETEDDDPSTKLESCKKVLRCLAWRLGMHKVAVEKKRAIQFGARTAKMTTGKTKGTTPLS